MTQGHQELARYTLSVIGTNVDVLSWEAALGKIQRWSAGKEARYVCITNVHSIVTAHGDPAFKAVLSEADMVTPDGAPVAWMLRRFGAAGQARINGPDLMWRYFAQASQRGESVYLYGGTEDTIARLRQRIKEVFPALEIAGTESPPFRPLTQDEEAAAIARINNSGAGTVWVSLGCPKQELWMARHRHQVQGVMIGVGAAFDYHAGTVKRAPVWMQQRGLEWLYRLASEPGRLWRRYFFTNSIFIWLAARQLLSGK